MKRAKHTLSHYRMVTAKMGELFPVGCVPVLPGDTFQHSTEALIRVSPLNTPVMHPVRVRLHHFFVPNRIVWPATENGGWENFITGGEDGNNTASIPTVTTTAEKKSVLAYLGLPPLAGSNITALSLRAVNMIYNEYYRDEQIIPKRSLNENSLPYIAWEKDYFTSARPSSQLGPTVTIPVSSDVNIGTAVPAEVQGAAVKDPNGLWRKISTGAADATAEQQLFASSTTADINAFRVGFALQRYQEARSRYGARFVEYLRYLGITPSDARLQRPEFLAGGSTRLNFSEVLQTTPAGQANEPGVGDLYGHGIAGVRSNRYRKFFEEHGYVITMMSIRPKSIYQNGIPREYIKRTKEDFFQKELANLGQQEVDNREINANASAATFGYQDRYMEYRNHPSQVGQDFRDVLNSWHLARDLDTGTALNQSFVECKPSDRIYQVTGEYDNLWIMVNHRIVARRMVPKRANPRVI